MRKTMVRIGMLAALASVAGCGASANPAEVPESTLCKVFAGEEAGYAVGGSVGNGDGSQPADMMFGVGIRIVNPPGVRVFRDDLTQRRAGNIVVDVVFRDAFRNRSVTTTTVPPVSDGEEGCYTALMDAPHGFLARVESATVRVEEAKGVAGLGPTAIDLPGRAHHPWETRDLPTVAKQSLPR